MTESNESQNRLHYLLTSPQQLYTNFCEMYQEQHENVQLSTIMNNTQMKANFLYSYYEETIQPHNSHSEVENDEEYSALLSFYTCHMTNVANSTNPSHFHDGKKSNHTNREARNASFQYCMRLIPCIQKKLVGLY